MNPLEGSSAAGAGTQQSTGVEVQGLEIRSVYGVAEYQQCAVLQRRIWGTEYEDIVPASMLQVCWKAGGVLAAAIRPNGEMAGFVFGIVSIHNGDVTHWSHMLGVLPEYRGQGIGQALKYFQRTQLQEQGIATARWTFDPLVSGNANFNINLLGARIEAYGEEVYGDTGSALHSFGTDRFIAVWDLDHPLPPDRADAMPRPVSDTPVINQIPTPGTSGAGTERRVPSGVGGAPLPANVRIEIPRDVLRIARDHPDEALAWRHSTRDAFQACLASGYRVTGFDLGQNGGRGSYLLTRAR